MKEKQNEETVYFDQVNEVVPSDDTMTESDYTDHSEISDASESSEEESGEEHYEELVDAIQ